MSKPKPLVADQILKRLMFKKTCRAIIRNGGCDQQCESCPFSDQHNGHNKTCGEIGDSAVGFPPLFQIIYAGKFLDGRIGFTDEKLVEYIDFRQDKYGAIDKHNDDWFSPGYKEEVEELAKQIRKAYGYQ